jgi:hypothetical protein
MVLGILQTLLIQSKVRARHQSPLRLYRASVKSDSESKTKEQGKDVDEESEILRMAK